MPTILDLLQLTLLLKYFPPCDQCNDCIDFPALESPIRTLVFGGSAIRSSYESRNRVNRKKR